MDVSPENVKKSGLTIEKIYELLITIVGKADKAVEEEMNKFDGMDNEVQLDQQKMIVLQSKVQSWNNISGLASGMLRAIEDSLQAIMQNIREVTFRLEQKHNSLLELHFCFANSQSMLVLVGQKTILLKTNSKDKVDIDRHSMLVPRILNLLFIN
jgi:type III secretion apparatus needle protein